MARGDDYIVNIYTRVKDYRHGEPSATFENVPENQMAAMVKTFAERDEMFMTVRRNKMSGGSPPKAMPGAAKTPEEALPR
jgi:hypothetical protein